MSGSVFRQKKPVAYHFSRFSDKLNINVFITGNQFVVDATHEVRFKPDIVARCIQFAVDVEINLLVQY